MFSRVYPTSSRRGTALLSSPCLRSHTILGNCKRLMSSNVLPTTLGIVGLGSMGSKLVENYRHEGFKSLFVYDLDDKAVNNVLAPGVTSSTIGDMAKQCDAIISILPNDEVLSNVTGQLLSVPNNGNKFVHISCSTVSPSTSRSLQDTYTKSGQTLIASPVFARPDGLANKHATWMISGKSERGREVASAILSKQGNCIDYGDDIGAANVVKLCGNFLIAASIESISEAMALSEKHGVDRVAVMQLLSSTIFDCLIYKGYGQRVSERDHKPGGFSLTLGYKDVSLVRKAAHDADVPMPFLSTLIDRFTSAKAKGRSEFDWSAIGLGCAEDAGIDISEDVQRNRKLVEESKTQ